MATNKPSVKEVKIKVTGEFGKGFKQIIDNIKEVNSNIKELISIFDKLGGSLKNDLSSPAEKAAKDIDKVNDKLEETSKDADDAGKKTKVLGKAFEGLGARIRTFAQYRVINATMEAIKNLGTAAVELESNFANIQAIVSASDSEMGKLRNTILRVGEASKYSVEEIAKATTMLGQAGLSADEINNVLETTTQLAAGTGSELSNTVDLMTSALAVWGLNSEEASHLSDVMVTGMNRTKATLETFRMAVQYAGATMASLNVSFDEFASVAAAASNAGLRASVVGTGLRAMTSELISPTKKMVAGLAQLGLSTEDVNIESQGLVNVLYKLKNAGLTAANAYDLFGKRAAQFVLAAQGQLDVVDELRVAFNESGATLKAYSTQMDTISAQATALGNTLKSVASDVLKQVSWMIKDTLSGLNAAIQKAHQWIKDLYNVTSGENNIKENKYANEKDELEEIRKSAFAFYKVLDDLSNRDYGDNAEKAISDLNEVIKNMNNQLGLSIDYIQSIEELPDAFSKLKNMNLWVERDKTKNLNYLNEQRAQEIVDASPYSRSDIWFSNLKSGKIKFEDLKRNVEESIKNFRNNNQELMATEFEVALSYVEDAWDLIKDEVKSQFGSEEFKKRSEEIKDKGASIKEIIAKKEKELKELGENFDITNENLDDIVNNTKKFVTELNNKYGDIKDDTNEYVKELNNTITDETEKEELVRQASDAKKKTSEALINYLNDLAKLLESKILMGSGNVDSYKSSLSKILSDEFVKNPIFSQKNAFDLYVDKAHENNKKPSSTPRSSGDPIRERAEKFNQRYLAQESALKTSEYKSRKLQAQISGTQSHLSEIDPTGTLSEIYSSTAQKLSTTQAMKKAREDYDLLNKYKKDYDDLFNKVNNNEITLEEADKQSAGVISKMRELTLSTEEATAKFGDLNDIDLSDCDNEIEKTKKELDEINESADNFAKAGWEGFKYGFKKMADAYSAAGIGKSIAEDLGNGMADALNSIVDGSKSAKEAFSDMARSILQDISKMLIRMAVMKAMTAALGMSDGGQVPSTNPNQDIVLGGEYANGGFIPKLRAAAGTPVRGGIQGRDSVPAMLMPGEYVLKKSAVDALGTNFLNDLNNNAAQTLTNTSANLLQNPYESSSESEPAVVNVWVVSKEEEAKMGPNDVIATISKDIMTGGQTRRLIQSVVAGRK